MIKDKEYLQKTKHCRI